MRPLRAIDADGDGKKGLVCVICADLIACDIDRLTERSEAESARVNFSMSRAITETAKLTSSASEAEQRNVKVYWNEGKRR